jgi:membrane-associated phospholipid phosphatase
MRKLIVVMFVIPFVAIAQPDTLRRTDFGRGLDGILTTYPSPVRWKGKDWLKLGGIITATAIISFADESVRDYWRGVDHNRFLDGINDVGDYYGRTYSGMIFSGAIYLHGVLFKNSWSRETGLMLGTSWFTADILQTGIKYAVGRARPRLEFGQYHFKSFGGERYRSFASGHMTTAFTLSYVMARQSEKTVVKVFFYSLAGATAFCRLYSDQHWISDVLFGGVIAYYCSESVMNRLNGKPSHHPRKVAWHLGPTPVGVLLIGRM